MSSTVNQNFDKAVQCFKDELEQIISSGILPIEVQTSAADKKITEDSLRSTFENSINEKFTIAVCGEVKAGKSTLLRIINDIFKRDSGKIEIDGKEVEENEELKQKLVFVPDDLYFFPKLVPLMLLLFCCCSKYSSFLVWLTSILFFILLLLPG